ncbi:right-handed parallel beta-helix repeat-containing protein [uncultured Proteiniphilum sp.]|uniref:right-handed parallel beta-helix repeat-containing protein n=1 Tax=uncultured Proteiniphilum sp. TaxID=497637 RepID=UPI00261C3ABF|nr:right-handed parallel beta-helix repeat-containing protein [uncultured Proteiniphilum sp.]
MKRNYIIILGVVLLCFPFHISYGQGARYTGSYTKSAAIQHVGKSNFVIEGLEITNGDQSLIVLYNCENVIIRNNKLSGASIKRAISLDNCKNITIVDNTFENIQSGLVAHKSQSIKFEYNDMTNVVGPEGGGTIGKMAQFDKVSGTGNSISYNVCENFPGKSSPDDIINLYQSHGTAQSPIVVKGNWLRGGGPSPSGGGIILGDFGGSYQIAEDNIVVNAGQYGISIAGGNNMTIRNNKIYGSRQSFTNIGLYAANWSESLGKSSNITVANNTVNYTNKDGVVNNWWFAGNVEPVIGKETNVYDRSLSASILPDKIIGRARSSSTPGNETPGGGSTPLPEENKPTEPEPTPEEQQPGNTDENEESDEPGTSLPEIKNDPSILIYLDKYNRVCVNNWGRLESSATVTAANGAGEVIYSQSLTRFHTVLPTRPVPGNYTILVRNGNKAHLKTLYIR